MEKPKVTSTEPKVSNTWEHLEDFVRGHVQQFIQALLGSVTDLAFMFYTDNPTS
jgi:hypothetical protein